MMTVAGSTKDVNFPESASRDKCDKIKMRINLWHAFKRIISRFLSASLNNQITVNILLECIFFVS